MTIAFIGGGNMARALIEGLIRHGQAVEDIQVIDINPAVAQALEQELSLTVLQSCDQLNLEQISTLVFAVKPQQLPSLAKGLGRLPKQLRVISIAAGVTTHALSQWLKGHNNIVRAMPNTPALIGEGISGLYATSGVNQEDKLGAQSLLSAVGSVIWVDHETDLDAVTAVSGSGPAYFFWMMEEMQNIAQSLGLPQEIAQKLVLQTALGATKLASQSPDTLPMLREKVTSKGGTTEAALTILNQEHVAELLEKAILAARQKAEELGRTLSQQ
ncbi:MAG TPA: pyrroline-5-carboxylate reductase [Ferrovaceae bacterium]|nr:pyrroline-5-carboxylate reductase [Ferrovaceae bacterium]HQU06132.1 pyrroline-5-carboxylate reductase [Ferrovaceae bacterium]